MLRPTTCHVLVLLITGVFSQHYELSQTYTSHNFFDEFTLFSKQDPTGGFVQYVPYETAVKSRLIGNSTGYVHLGVDFTNVYPSSSLGRPSVRLQSKKTFTEGLFVADLSHIPTGCGTWPAFWTVGLGDWPTDGEIDIVENVNDATNNNAALHAAGDCSVMANAAQTSEWKSTDCNIVHDGNQGCGTTFREPFNFGQGFNRKGGGVYAMEWTSSTIQIWFFPHDNVPRSISSADSSSAPMFHPDTSVFPPPSASFAGPCSSSFGDRFFNHTIIFDTTFCGGWAGGAYGTGDSSCPTVQGASPQDSCRSFVGNNPHAFNETYWGIRSLRVWQKVPGSAPVSSTSQAALAQTALPKPTTQSIKVSSLTGGVVTSGEKSNNPFPVPMNKPPPVEIPTGAWNTEGRTGSSSSQPIGNDLKDPSAAAGTASLVWDALDGSTVHELNALANLLSSKSPLALSSEAPSAQPPIPLHSLGDANKALSQDRQVLADSGDDQLLAVPAPARVAQDAINTNNGYGFSSATPAEDAWDTQWDVLYAEAAPKLDQFALALESARPGDTEPATRVRVYFKDLINSFQKFFRGLSEDQRAEALALITTPVNLNSAQRRDRRGLSRSRRRQKLHTTHNENGPQRHHLHHHLQPEPWSWNDVYDYMNAARSGDLIKRQWHDGDAGDEVEGGLPKVVVATDGGYTSREPTPQLLKLIRDISNDLKVMDARIKQRRNIAEGAQELRSRQDRSMSGDAMDDSGGNVRKDDLFAEPDNIDSPEVHTNAKDEDVSLSSIDGDGEDETLADSENVSSDLEDIIHKYFSTWDGEIPAHADENAGIKPTEISGTACAEDVAEKFSPYARDWWSAHEVNGPSTGEMVKEEDVALVSDQAAAVTEWEEDGHADGIASQ